MPIFVRRKTLFLGVFLDYISFPSQRSTFAYSMSNIVGNLWHLAIIWPIRKWFLCILQGVRFLLADHTLLFGAYETFSYQGWWLTCGQDFATPEQSNYRYHIALLAGFYWILGSLSCIIKIANFRVRCKIVGGLFLHSLCSQFMIPLAKW